jgi:MYXO-CTERM domain-containing protein
MTGGCACELASPNGSAPALALTALMIVAAVGRRARRP